MCSLRPIARSVPSPSVRETAESAQMARDGSWRGGGGRTFSGDKRRDPQVVVGGVPEQRADAAVAELLAAGARSTQVGIVQIGGEPDQRVDLPDCL